MECRRCAGRVFLDRTFSDNKNYELFCILCGDRRFVSKYTELGKWLERQEQARKAEKVL